jgi:hypothetical protein
MLEGFATVNGSVANPRQALCSHLISAFYLLRGVQVAFDDLLLRVRKQRFPDKQRSVSLLDF